LLDVVQEEQKGESLYQDVRARSVPALTRGCKKGLPEYGKSATSALFFVYCAIVSYRVCSQKFFRTVAIAMMLTTNEMVEETREWIAAQITAESLKHPNDDEVWSFITERWKTLTTERAEKVLNLAMADIPYIATTTAALRPTM
jgi:hypothetical protein